MRAARDQSIEGSPHFDSALLVVDDPVEWDVLGEMLGQKVNIQPLHHAFLHPHAPCLGTALTFLLLH